MTTQTITSPANAGKGQIAALYDQWTAGMHEFEECVRHVDALLPHVVAAGFDASAVETVVFESLAPQASSLSDIEREIMGAPSTCADDDDIKSDVAEFSVSREERLKEKRH
jgi:hypothetical protein